MLKNSKNKSILDKVADNKHLFWVLVLVFVFVVMPTAPAKADWCASVDSCALEFIKMLIGWMGTAIAGAADLLNLTVNIQAMGNAGSITVVSSSWTIIRDFANMFFIIILIVMAFATIFDVSDYDARKLLPKFLVAAVLINFSLVIGTIIIKISQAVSSTFLASIGSIGDQLGQALTGGLTGITRDTQGNLSTIVANLATASFSALIALIAMAIMLVCFLAAGIFAFIRVPVLWFLLILSPIAWITGILPSTRHINAKWWKHFMAWNLFLPIYLFFLYFGIYFLSQSGNTITQLSSQYAKAEIAGWSLSFQVVFNYILAILFILGGLFITFSMSFFSGTHVVGVARWSRNAVLGATGLTAAGGAVKQRYEQFKREGIYGIGGTEGAARMQAGIAQKFGVRDAADKQLAKDIDIYKDRFRNQTEEQLRGENDENLNKGPKYEQLARREMLNQRSALRGDEALETYKMYGEGSARSREFIRGLDMKRFSPAERESFYNAIPAGDSLSRQKIVNAMVESGDIQDTKRLVEMSGVFTDENQRLEYFKKAKETIKNYRPDQRREILESTNKLITNDIKANVAELMNEEKELKDDKEIRRAVDFIGKSRDSKAGTQQFKNRLNKFLDSTRKYDAVTAANMRVEHGIGVTEVDVIDPATGAVTGKKSLIDPTTGKYNNDEDRKEAQKRTEDKEFSKLEDKEVIGQRQGTSKEYQGMVGRNITPGRIENISSRSGASKAQLKTLAPAFKTARESANLELIRTKKAPSLRKDIKELEEITKKVKEAAEKKAPNLAAIKASSENESKSVIKSAKKTVEEIRKLDLPADKMRWKNASKVGLNNALDRFDEAMGRKVPRPEPEDIKEHDETLAGDDLDLNGEDEGGDDGDDNGGDEGGGGPKGGGPDRGGPKSGGPTGSGTSGKQKSDQERARKDFENLFRKKPDSGGGSSGGSSGGGAQPPPPSEGYTRSRKSEADYTRYYSTLGVNRSASPEEINTAYRNLVIANHPDTTTNPEEKKIKEEKTKQITEAYREIQDFRKGVGLPLQNRPRALPPYMPPPPPVPPKPPPDNQTAKDAKKGFETIADLAEEAGEKRNPPPPPQQPPANDDEIVQVGNEFEFRPKPPPPPPPIPPQQPPRRNLAAVGARKVGIIPPRTERALNNPLTTGDIFSPELELKKIRQAPREEQPQLLQEFKEKLAYQKEGLANIQEQVIQKVRENPDASLEQLYGWTSDLGKKYGLTDEQKGVARDLLKTYSEKHLNIRNIRQKYPDDKKLYQAMFGHEPKGKIEVVEGPATLSFRCHNLEDYATIYSQKFLSGVGLERRDLDIADMSGGASISSSNIPGLEGTITAVNLPRAYTQKDADQIEKHEEQHAIKKLFGDRIQHRTAFSRLLDASNEGERELALKGLLRNRRERIADERARDEILAYFKGGNRDSQGTLQELTKSGEKGGLYDYLKLDKQDVLKEADGWLKTYGPERFGEEFKPKVEKAAEEVYGKEYQDLLKEGIQAVQTLTKKGYTKEETMALLIQEPLSRWDKVVKRLTTK